MRLTSFEVDKGCTVTLSVIIAGFPAPDIRWTLDDEELLRCNDRFIFEEDDTQNKYSLIITHITRAQEGVYRCIASNCEGSCSTMGFITVRGKGASTDAVTGNCLFLACSSHKIVYMPSLHTHVHTPSQMDVLTLLDSKICHVVYQFIPYILHFILHWILAECYHRY